MTPPPPEQYLLVGPLWALFEAALNEAATSGNDSNEKINSLRGAFSRADIDSMHYIRQERNQLMHHPPKAIDDSEKWRKLCEQFITRLKGDSNSKTDTFWVEHCEGVVSQWNREKKEGFVLPRGETQEIFFQSKDLFGREKAIEVGQRVSFSVSGKIDNDEFINKILYNVRRYITAEEVKKRYEDEQARIRKETQAFFEGQAQSEFNHIYIIAFACLFILLFLYVFL